MTVRNCTPHDIHLFTSDLQPLATVPSVANIRVSTQRQSQISDTLPWEVPVSTVTFGALDGLPDDLDDTFDLLIVSQIAAAAIRQQRPDLVSRLLLVDQTIRQDNDGALSADPKAAGKIVGCLGFAKP